MKNDPSNTEDIASRRIITPLAPKRVPSVAPGLEGLAAMAPDACEAAPEIEVSAPEFVEAAPAVEFLEPEVANCGVGGNAWEQSIPEAVELPTIDGEGSPSEAAEDSEEVVVTEEIPEMISCEVLPEGGIPEEWLRPIWVVESPENLLTSLFEGESDLDADGNGGGEAVDGEGVPFVLESGFEICVLPVPENFSVDIDPNELLLRYNEFLRENPDWVALDPDMMEIQVVTPSSYFGELEFGTPSKAASFDSWYERLYVQSNDGDDADGSGTIMVTRPDGSEYGTIVRDPNLSGVGGIPAEWMRGGTDQSGILYSTSGGIGPVPGTGLALSGGTGNFGGETVVTGGEVAIDPALYQPRYENFLAANPGWVNQHNGSDAAFDRWRDIAYGTGQATPAESEALLRVYTSEFAENGETEGAVSDARSITGDFEVSADLQQLPFELTQMSDDLALPGSVEPRLATGGVSPAQIQIVEFSVLSPSEPIQANSDGLDLQAATELQLSQLSENGVEAAAADSAGALPDADPSQDLFAHPVTSGQEQASTTTSSHKIDAPTATAGAVAAGTVVHGGAAAPAIRRPLFKA